MDLDTAATNTNNLRDESRVLATAVDELADDNAYQFNSSAVEAMKRAATFLESATNSLTKAGAELEDARLRVVVQKDPRGRKTSRRRRRAHRGPAFDPECRG